LQASQVDGEVARTALEDVSNGHGWQSTLTVGWVELANLPAGQTTHEGAIPVKLSETTWTSAMYSPTPQSQAEKDVDSEKK
tara:strand:- start:205 stop:447 length:243 start_codon:yes stop_codon:yes gene_type:complete